MSTAEYAALPFLLLGCAVVVVLTMLVDGVREANKKKRKQRRGHND